MKKISMTVLVVVLTAFVCFGCTNTNTALQTPLATTQMPTIFTTVTALPSVGITTTITGVVTDATMNTITIKDEKGNKYELIKEGAEVDSNHGILIGDVAEITYTGELQNQNSTNFAKATKIKITTSASYPPTTGVQ